MGAAANAQWQREARVRATLARNNRRHRDAPMIACLSKSPLVLLDGTYGEWMAAKGTQRGGDLPFLGALNWGGRHGQATERIARVIGLTGIPDRADA
jgi:hypothetical protein